jgi:hypothetical protein
MAKNEKKTIMIDDVEYNFDDLTQEQQIMVNHIADLERKIGASNFNLQQLEFGKSAFVNALSQSLNDQEPNEAE